MFTRILIVSAVALSAMADSVPVGADEGDVVVGQQVVLRVRYPTGGMTVKQRADVITERINKQLGSYEFSPSRVRVEVRRGQHLVLVGNTLIATADARTAAHNRCTRMQLANTWAKNLRNAIPKAKAIRTRPDSSL